MLISQTALWNEAFQLPDVWNYHTITAVNHSDTVWT